MYVYHTCNVEFLKPFVKPVKYNKNRAVNIKNILMPKITASCLSTT